MSPMVGSDGFGSLRFDGVPPGVIDGPIAVEHDGLFGCERREHRGNFVAAEM
jgi:hypothetical protein